MSAEPSFAFQQAIRERLVSTSAVLALVPPEHIFDGGTRPEKFPCIIIGEGQTSLAGHYSNYRNVIVRMTVHLWALEDGLAMVKRIGGAVWNAIGTSLSVPDFDLTDGVRVEQTIYMRDPSKEHGHGVITISALMGCHL